MIKFLVDKISNARANWYKQKNLIKVSNALNQNSPQGNQLHSRLYSFFTKWIGKWRKGIRVNFWIFF